MEHSVTSPSGRLPVSIRLLFRNLVFLFLLIGVIYLAFSDIRLHSWFACILLLTVIPHIWRRAKWLRANFLTIRGVLCILLVINSSLLAVSGTIITFVYSPNLSNIHKSMAYLLILLVISHVIKNRLDMVLKRKKLCRR